MGKVIFGMTMSIDGYITDSEGSLGRLYSDLPVGDKDGEELPPNELLDEAIRDTGAVVMGRNSFEMAGDLDSYADNYEFQVPLFILTHEPPAIHPKENDRLTVTFVTDGIESAVSQAKAAAGNKDVTIVGGPDTGAQALLAGLVDELQVDVMPYIFGGGLRLFDALGREIGVEKVMAVDMGPRTHLRFRVLH